MKFSSVQKTIKKNIVKPSVFYARRNLLNAWGKKGDPGKEVLFVSGVHRSGTNMIMNFLDQCWSCDVFHESDSRAFDSFIMRDRSVITDLARKSAGRVVVFKALHEADELAQLIQAFQPAKAIWMYRDYNDVVNSLTTRWKGNRNSYDKIAEALDDADWRCRGISSDTLDRIRRGYRADDNNATANAWFWFWRNMIFFDLGLQERDDVLLVKYDDFVTHTEEVGSIIAERLIPLLPVRSACCRLWVGGECRAQAVSGKQQGGFVFD